MKNTIIGAMSITINRVIISLMNSFTLLKLQIPTIITIITIISSVGIKWFKDNKMIVNRGKFQGIILEKKEKQSYTRHNQN